MYDREVTNTEIINRFNKNQLNLLMMYYRLVKISAIIPSALTAEKERVDECIQMITKELARAEKALTIKKMTLLASHYEEAIKIADELITDIAKTKRINLPKHVPVIDQTFISLKELHSNLSKDLRMELSFMQMKLIRTNHLVKNEQLSQLIIDIHSILQHPPSHAITALNQYIIAIQRVHKTLSNVINSSQYFEWIDHLILLHEKLFAGKESEKIRSSYEKYLPILKKLKLAHQYEGVEKYYLLKEKRLQKKMLEYRQKDLREQLTIYKLKEQPEKIAEECQTSPEKKANATIACNNFINKHLINKHLMISKALGGIKAYGARPRGIKNILNTHLSLFSVCFDNDRGWLRARVYYFALNNPSYSINQKLLVLYALLVATKGKPLQLQKDVIERMGLGTREDAQKTVKEAIIKLYCPKSLSPAERRNQLKKLDKTVDKIVCFANNPPSKKETDFSKLDSILNEESRIPSLSLSFNPSLPSS